VRSRNYILQRSVIQYVKDKGKSKVIPLQAQCGPEGG